MARRDDLAGLAALGALGYALTRGSKSDEEPRRPQFASDTTAAPASEAIDRGPDYDRELARAGRGPIAIGAAPARGGSVAPRQAAPYSMASDTINPDVKMAPAPAMMSQDEMARIRAGVADKRTRGTPVQYGGATTPAYQRIPNEFAGRDRTGIVDNPVTSTELSRNLNALLMGRGPTGLTQKAALAADAATAKRAQQAYNARAAARRAEEGLSDAEVADLMRRRALSEADTTGGAMGYKKGGKTKAKPKKMASGGTTRSSASKRADGIATKGKTKCKMY